MLGRAEDSDVVVLTRNGKGDLAFQVHVVLAADRHPALDAVLRAVEGRGDIAAFQLQRCGDMWIAGIHRTDGIKCMRQDLIVDLCQLGGPAGQRRGLLR